MAQVLSSRNCTEFFFFFEVCMHVQPVPHCSARSSPSCTAWPYMQKLVQACSSLFCCCYCRYEDEEHPGVCQAMEHAARCFMFDADAAHVEGHEGEGQEQLQMQQEATD
jgi:hypothetical protein